VKNGGWSDLGSRFHQVDFLEASLPARNSSGKASSEAQNQPMSWSDLSLPNWYLNDAGGQVSSGNASGNVVTLQLTAAAPADATLDYLQDASWNHTTDTGALLFGANGIPVLTFADVPIEMLSLDEAS